LFGFAEKRMNGWFVRAIGIARDETKIGIDHKNLIVRVWGWSGYFVELEEQY
jgi:hypothetical protein